jgi:glyoxylase-like metal-dependent hydrolase (beta-lactamase superfamily II)
VVVDPESKEALVVDPLLDRTTETLRALSSAGATLKWVVDTHSHADHLSGAPALHERTGAEVVMSAASDWRKVTRRVAEGDVLALGEQAVRVRAAPGVAPDAIVLEGPRVLFTGDTLLVGTMGLKDVPGADAMAHYDAVQRIVDPLPDDVVIHPGHDDMGRSETTVKAEKRGNRWVREKDRDAYLARWEADPRRVPKEAAEILAANRQGEASPPPEAVEAAGKAAAAATARGGVPAAPSPPSGALLAEGTAQLWVVASVLVIAFAVLGVLVHRMLALGAALVAIVQLAVALPSLAPKKKKTIEGLYYHGPAKKGPSRG